MKGVLSQSQIDDLINGIDSGNIEIDEIIEETNKNVKLYDFSRPNKFSPEQVKVLKEISDEFSRLIVPHVSTSLRVRSEAFVAYVDEQTFYEYSNSISPNSTLAIIDFKPLNGSIIVEASNTISNAVIDLILGGNVEKMNKKDSYSEIELTLIKRFFRLMMKPMQESWKNVIEIDPFLNSVETSAQHAQIVAPSDIVSITTIKVTISGVSGFINFCIPYIVIEPVIKQLNSKYLFNSSKENDEKPSLEDYFESKIAVTSIEMTCILGNAELTFGEIDGLQEGDVIKLNSTLKDKVTLNVDDSVKYKGIVGSKEKKVAFKILEIVEEGAEAFG